MSAVIKHDGSSGRADNEDVVAKEKAVRTEKVVFYRIIARRKSGSIWVV